MTTVDPLGYGATSFWLETCDDDLTPRPALDGSADADVAILGAGLHRVCGRPTSSFAASRA